MSRCRMVNSFIDGQKCPGERVVRSFIEGQNCPGG